MFVKPYFDSFVKDNGFEFNNQYKGRVDVAQSTVMKPDDFTEQWWQRAGVQVFRKAEDRLTGKRVQLSRMETLSRQNDTFLLWELERDNIDSMIHYVERKLL